jgi:hypothetical protein
VATDIRLYMRGAIDDIIGLLRELRLALLDLAEQHADTILPGFTHMQVAQPITFGHHMLAYVEMFGRDAERMADAASASTACRWAPPRWPAPPSRSTACAWPRPWASTTSAATRWTPSRTATSPSNSAPPLRW